MVAFDPQALAGWTGGHWDPQPPASIRGINHDTRTCEEGNLYIALHGERHDGHTFVKDAAARGASGAMVTETWCDAEADFPLLRVPDTAAALRDLAAAYRREINPSIVGVTGSAGKTTVKELTAQMLGRAMPTARSLGNWNNHIGLPLSLLAMPPDTKVAVFEVATSQPGEIRQLCDLLKPDNGMLTNVGLAHVEGFGSVEAIVAEKSELLKSLPAHGVAVLGRESEFFESLAESVSGRVVTTARGGHADYTIIACDRKSREVQISETETGDSLSVPVDPFSAFQIENVMMSIAMARVHKVEWENIHEAIASYQPLPMRWQREWVRDILIINDAYNANPLNMRAAIDAFCDECVSAGKWLVLGDMRELGDSSRDEHYLLGEYLAGKEWSGLIVAGDNAGVIADGAETAGLDSATVFRCADSSEAADVLCANVAPGDGVLVKASRVMQLEKVILEFKERC